jgi:hypothetical protein
MSEPLFVVSQHPESMRNATVCDEGQSVWFYLSERDDQSIAADCWLLNKVCPPESLESFSSRDGPPPVIAKFAGPGAQGAIPMPSEIEFVWSKDGHSVAVLIGGDPLGFIALNNGGGYSKHLRKAGPYGQPFEVALFQSLFGEPAE